MKFLADENFNNEIIRGVQRRVPDAEIVRAQDTELSGQSDPKLLEWAVDNDYLILTHDVNTMRGYFYERVNAGFAVPGLFLVRKRQSIGPVIESLVLILLASDQDEWKGEVRYLPL